MRQAASGILAGFFLALLIGLGGGCKNVNVGQLQLGMEPEAVKDAIGSPYTIRAAKTYAGEEWTEIWEYLPPLFTWNPKTYWVYFENGKVVQWGEPGDFTGRQVPAVIEYNPQKSTAR
jgi:hypothetical protein